MANVIGYNGALNNTESVANNTQVQATKFTAPANMTPIAFYANFEEQWGVGGTCYVAIYSDNAGTPDTVIWEGNASYAALHGFSSTPLLKIDISSPPSLTSGTSYWLAIMTKQSSGTHFIINQTDNETGYEIKKWTASVSGTFDAAPSIDSTVSNERLALYAVDAVTVSANRNAKAKGKVTTSDSRNAKTSGTGVVSSNRPARIVSKDTASSNRSANFYGGYQYTFQDTFDTANNYDAAASSHAEWTGDGAIRISDVA